MKTTDTQIAVSLAEDGSTVATYRGQSLTVRPSDWLHRASRSGLPFSAGRERLEHTQAFKPVYARGRSGDVGLFWRLSTTEPMVRDAIQGAISAIGAAPWRIEKPTLPSHLKGNPAAQAALDRHYDFASLVWASWTDTGLDRVWSDWIADILQFSMICGFYLGEITAIERQLALPQGPVRTYLIPEIPLTIMPKSVDEWVFQGNPDTGMVAIVQETFDQIDTFGNAGPGSKVIQWEKLIHVPFMPASKGDLEGRSILRACARLIEMKQKALQLWALATEVNALGIMTVKQDPQRPLTTEAEDKLDDELGNRTAEHVSHIIMPPGDHELQIISPASATPDLGPQIDALDRQIGHALGNVHRLMSLQGTGSYSARQDASGEARDAYDYLADLPARAAERLLRRFIILNFPMDARLGMVFTPNVAHAVVEERDNSKYASTVATLTGAGLLSSNTTTENMLREQLDLPPLEEKANTAETPRLDGEALMGLRLAYQTGMLHDPELGPKVLEQYGLPPLTGPAPNAKQAPAPAPQPAEDASEPEG